MTYGDEVFCVVPARSGSKRIVDKNLQPVGGRSLLERSIEVCLAAFGQVWVSTDSERYAEVARGAGATVPALRPARLAGDDVPTDEVVRAAARQWAPLRAEVLVVVQCTSPFTTVDDLHGVVRALREGEGAASAMTARRLPPHTAFALVDAPSGARFLAPELARRRTQELPVLAAPTGGAYAAPVGPVLAGRDLVAEPVALVLVPEARALDVDEPDDLLELEAIER